MSFTTLLSPAAHAWHYPESHGWRPSGGRQQGPLQGAYPECSGWNSTACEPRNPNFDGSAYGPWTCASYSEEIRGSFTATEGDIYSAAREAQASCVNSGDYPHECEPAGCRRAARGY